MNHDAPLDTNGADRTSSSGFANGRRLFQRLRDADEKHLQELQKALARLIASHYSLLQSGAGRNEVTTLLVAGTMRSTKIPIAGTMPGHVTHYASQLKNYLQIRCRFESMRPSNGAITLTARRPRKTVDGE